MEMIMSNFKVPWVGGQMAAVCNAKFPHESTLSTKVKSEKVSTQKKLSMQRNFEIPYKALLCILKCSPSLLTT